MMMCGCESDERMRTSFSTLESSTRGIFCTHTCLLTTKWPVRRWRRSTAVPKEPFPSVFTFSYLR